MIYSDMLSGALYINVYLLILNVNFQRMSKLTVYDKCNSMGVC